MAFSRGFFLSSTSSREESILARPHHSVAEMSSNKSLGRKFRKDSIKNMLYNGKFNYFYGSKMPHILSLTDLYASLGSYS